MMICNDSSSYHPHQSSPPHVGDPPVTSRPPSQGWMTSSPAASETDSNDTGVSSSPSGGGGGPFKRCEALYDYTDKSSRVVSMKKNDLGALHAQIEKQYRTLQDLELCCK